VQQPGRSWRRSLNGRSAVELQSNRSRIVIVTVSLRSTTASGRGRAVATVSAECSRRPVDRRCRLPRQARRHRSIQSTSRRRGRGRRSAARRRWPTCRSRDTARRWECGISSSTVRNCQQRNSDDMHGESISDFTYAGFSWDAIFT